METDEPITNQSLRNYLDNYVSERGIICKPKKGQSKQQQRGRSRSRKLSKQGKPSSSQNRKLQQSPRKRSVSKSVNRSSSVSFAPKNSQKRKGKGRRKDHDCGNCNPFVAELEDYGLMMLTEFWNTIL